MHATEFLKAKDVAINAPVVAALTGEERSLKLSVIEAIGKAALSDGETPTKYPSKDTEWQTVKSELLTVPMWGGKRVIVIEDANEFLTDNRAALEAYCEKPSKKSVLILDLKSLPANQKIYKIINKNGAVVDCSPLKGAALTKWLQEFVKNEYGKSIAPNASALLVELVGEHLGHLEQEIGKLASYAGETQTIDAESVRKLVGDWKTETTWQMNDATRDARMGDALHALDKLLNSGSHPVMLLGGLTYTFKKYATGTELAKQGTPLGEALTQAGCWANEVQAAQSYLKRLGYAKASQLTRRLIDTDAGLKGASSLNERVQVELLLMKLAGLAE